MNDSVSITAGYDDLYGKHKKGIGDEETYAFNFGFAWMF